MHDGTMVWILPINTVFLRMVDAKTLDIYKVPYSMRKVPGSFTGEVLHDELIKHISCVKKVPGQSAFDSIESKLVEIRCKPAKLTVEQEYKMLTGKLEEYSQKKMWSKVSSISEEIQKMEEVTPSLKDLDTDKVQSTPSSDMSEFHLDVPPRPEYFKLATLQSVDEESKVIRMVVNSSNIPTVQVGDGCSVNLKGARLVQEKLGINCPFSRCNSHIASGAIRRGTAVSKKTAKPWDDIDSGVTQSKKKKTSSEKAKDALSTLAKNLRSVLCHFASSPKSSEMLNSALTALQMHEVHQLTWGSTRMCGFIYASLQCSEILVPQVPVLNLRSPPTYLGHQGSWSCSYWQTYIKFLLHHICGRWMKMKMARLYVRLIALVWRLLRVLFLATPTGQMISFNLFHLMSMIMYMLHSLLMKHLTMLYSINV